MCPWKGFSLLGNSGPLPAPPDVFVITAPLPVSRRVSLLQAVHSFRIEDPENMLESVLFVLRQFYKFVCPLQIFYEIEEMERTDCREEREIWYEI
ncbi:uncharacterized protein [Drosophila bipectinata]|uniref:uncharacterized protein n=1 Tax=Drosophila bipectinata TaxID=42026 RepID=UPI001C8AD19F|nr:uncharacterized protein LOC108125479 [Drosophila bipectinata]